MQQAKAKNNEIVRSICKKQVVQVINSLHPYSVTVPRVTRMCKSSHVKSNHTVRKVFKEQLGLKFVKATMRKGPSDEEVAEKKKYVAFLFAEFLLEPEEFIVVCFDESSVTNDLKPSKLWQHKEDGVHKSNPNAMPQPSSSRQPKLKLEPE